MSAEIDPADRDRAVEMMKAGRGRNAIARAVGIAPATVTKIAAEEHHEFGTAATAAATQARSATAQERRSAILHRLYGQAERILDELESGKFKTLIPVGFGAVEKTVLDFVPSAEMRNVTAALNTLLERAQRIEVMESDPQLDAAKSMLTRLGIELGVIDADAR